MTNTTLSPATEHRLTMENRKSLRVSGVTKVDSFDQHTMVLYTNMGELTVKGEGLHLELLNTESGDAAVSGKVHGLMYTDERPKNGFLGRLFR